MKLPRKVNKQEAKEKKYKNINKMIRNIIKRHYGRNGITEIKGELRQSNCLGEERANLSAFRTFVRFVLVWICWFPLPLGV